LSYAGQETANPNTGEEQHIAISAEAKAGLSEALRIPFPIRHESVAGLKAHTAWDTIDSIRRFGIDSTVPVEVAVPRAFTTTGGRATDDDA